MDADFSEVTLALVVNLETLRDVLKTMSIGGKRWWVASDPRDAASTGSVTIGHGDPLCTDRLNTLYYRFPVLNSAVPKIRTEQLVLLIDSSACIAQDPGYYLEDGRIVEDSQEDLLCCFYPIRNALIARLQAGDD
jgi:hypothetical protein